MVIESKIKNSHYHWGKNCEGWVLHENDSLQIKRELMPPGSVEILHFHAHSQQVFYLLQGNAAFNLDGTIFSLHANETIVVPKNTYHTIESTGTNNLIFLVVSEPPVQNDRFEIIDFEAGLEKPIKDLNVEWLQKYFHVETTDIQQLSNPKSEIIDKGGKIFYLKHNQRMIGTASLLKINETTFELAKMAITEKFQGLGLGKVLLKYCLDFAKQNHIHRLILFSNTQLAAAIHLYKKFGFVEVAMEPGHYDRANIKMVLDR